MPTVKEDLREGSNAKLSLREFDIVRAFLVAGIAGPGDGQTIAATQAAGIPPLGSPHPALPGALCHSLRSKPLGNGSFYVYALYKQLIRPVPYLEDVGGSLTVSQIHAALQGNPLAWKQATVNYTPMVPLNPSEGNFSLVPGKQVSQVATLAYKRLIATLMIRIYETQNPLTTTTAYAGSVNNDLWKGGQPRTWLVMPLHGSTKDQQVWDNTYLFSYNVDTWDEYAFYRDQTGRVPPDALADFVTDGSKTSGNGWGRFTMQPQIAFGTTFPQLT